jgi:hypothetical protein
MVVLDCGPLTIMAPPRDVRPPPPKTSYHLPPPPSDIPLTSSAYHSRLLLTSVSHSISHLRPSHPPLPLPISLRYTCPPLTLGHSPLSLPPIISFQVSYHSRPPWQMVPSRLLSQPHICPHIIAPCHSTSDLSQHSAHTFHHPHFPCHPPSVSPDHMGTPRLTFMTLAPSSPPRVSSTSIDWVPS